MSAWNPGRRASCRTAWPALALALVLPLPGCVFTNITFGDQYPGAASVAGIEPGRTTCAEVLDRLGPPEEFAQPTPLFGLRAWDPQELRVLEERDIFGRQTWTWIREHRSDHIYSIPFIFTWHKAEHQADRIMVTFDEQGIVTFVGAGPVEGTP